MCLLLKIHISVFIMLYIYRFCVLQKVLKCYGHNSKFLLRAGHVLRIKRVNTNRAHCRKRNKLFKVLFIFAYFCKNR